jgi:4-hydroxy-tetrahydrodipicolinate synthase
MLTQASLKGVFPALVTPFDSSGALDLRALRRLVNRLLDSGVHGLVPIGGTGEYTALSRAERRLIVETVVDENAKRAPVIAGVLAPGFEDAREAVRDFSAAGADAVMAITPFYATGAQDGIASYFRRLREASDLPLLLYEIPGRTNVALQAETVRRLAEDGTVIGMKYSSYDIPQFIRVVAHAGDKFAILSGEEPLFATHLAIGARGGILTTANLLPERWLEIFADASRGDLRAALEKQARLDPLLRAVFAETNPGPFKYLMEAAGEPCGQPRLPLLPPTDSLKATLRNALFDLGHNVAAA